MLGQLPERAVGLQVQAAWAGKIEKSVKPSVVSEWVEFGEMQLFLSLPSPPPPVSLQSFLVPSSLYLSSPSVSPAFSLLRRSDLSPAVPSASPLLLAFVIAPSLAVLSPTEIPEQIVLCCHLRASTIPDANPRTFVMFVGLMLDLRLREAIQMYVQALHQFSRMDE